MLNNMFYNNIVLINQQSIELSISRLFINYAIPQN